MNYARYRETETGIIHRERKKSLLMGTVFRRTHTFSSDNDDNDDDDDDDDDDADDPSRLS